MVESFGHFQGHYLRTIFKLHGPDLEFNPLRMYVVPKTRNIPRTQLTIGVLVLSVWLAIPHFQLVTCGHTLSPLLLCNAPGGVMQ